MVSHLADRLISTYAKDAKGLLDPFCGSGAILLAAQKRGIDVSGIDLNPLAPLYTGVKLRGFDARLARQLMKKWISTARKNQASLPIDWSNKEYWFTSGVLLKFERLRAAYVRCGFEQSRELDAILLAYTLSVRLCSRADQRSPKPFISKAARLMRHGRHFDPYATMTGLLEELSNIYYHRARRSAASIVRGDVASEVNICRNMGSHSHVITSPPYINAQDYFRNFKLELHLLEGLLQFKVKEFRDKFIGTERGDLLGGVPNETLATIRKLLPEMQEMEIRKPRLASVVHRYFHDMDSAFKTISIGLKRNACFVLVCGDNLVGGVRIRTWKTLEALLVERGFKLVDRFTDPISDRMLPPKRSGHKGLIKEEVVSAFRLG
jgi:hypothetical protein